MKPQEQIEIFTPLGSCVSCVFFHPVVGSVITHAKLPENDGKKEEEYYADSATQFAIDYFLQSGISHKEWRVKLFGGGIIAKSDGKIVDIGTMGWQNVIAALETLHKNRVSLSRGNFGGFGGRKIRFFADTGTVVLERVKKLHGGISVDSKTPVWLLLDSMKKRLLNIQEPGYSHNEDN